MKKASLLPVMLLFACCCFAQSNVGIGTTTPHASAILDIANTSKGILIPRMNTAQRNAIVNPLKGLLVFDNDACSFWMYNGAMWIEISMRNNTWGLKGNAATDSSTNFIGTTDAIPLKFRINNINAGRIDSALNSTGLGFRTLDSLTTGVWNSAFGYKALNYSTTGDYNTGIGAYALKDNITGRANTANGSFALLINSTGSFNTATGSYALFYNYSGSLNTAVGYGTGTYQGLVCDNTVSIGNYGYLNAASNQAFIGNLSTAWIGGNVSWSTFSDERVKVNMSDDVKGLDFITRLKPVTYYRKINTATELTGNKPTEDYPEKYDIEKIKFSGFLAQEVEQAAKNAGYDFSGIHRPKNQNELYSLSYESFVVPLVKAVQELSKKVEELEKQIEVLKNEYH